MICVVLLAVACFILPYSHAANKIEFKCNTATDNTKGTFTIFGIFDTPMTACYVKGARTGCSTIAGSTHVIPSQTQFDLDPTTTGCTATDGSVNTDKTTTFAIYCEQYSNVISSVDYHATLTCNWKEAFNKDVKITGDSVPITGIDIAAVPVSPAAVPGTLAAWKDGTTTQATTLALGDIFTINFVIPNTDTQVLNYAQIHSCEAYANAAFTGNKMVITVAGGCGPGPAGNMFLNTFGFVMAEDATAKTRTYTSGKIKTFSVIATAAGGTSLYIKCKIKTCSTKDKALCEQKDCSTNGRKRRDVSSDDTKTIEKTIAIRIVSKAEAERMKQESAERQLATCMNTISFVSIIAVLAGLLIVTIGFVIFFAVKATRSQTAQKESYPNAAYKA